MVSDTLRSHLHPDQIAPLRDRLPARLIALLEQAGDLAERTAVSAFVVGGFVRDLLLGRPNLDVDLVIEGDGIAYARALARAVGGSVKVHDRFGTTIVIFPDGFKLDVATARTESYDFPTALPTVKRSSIKEDLYRRDFTINTLAIRLNTGRFGELIDVFGGQRDLNEKTIRVLHSLSFVEDPTRVFRAVRFEQRFGFRLGKETLALIKGTVKMYLFRHLSSSRLSDELILLLSEEAPRKIVARLGELALLRCIHPALKWSTRLDALLKAVEEALNWHEMASSKRSDRKGEGDRWVFGVHSRSAGWLACLFHGAHGGDTRSGGWGDVKTARTPRTACRKDQDRPVFFKQPAAPTGQAPCLAAGRRLSSAGRPFRRDPAAPEGEDTIGVRQTPDCRPRHHLPACQTRDERRGSEGPGSQAGPHLRKDSGPAARRAPERRGPD